MQHWQDFFTLHMPKYGDPTYAKRGQPDDPNQLMLTILKSCQEVRRTEAAKLARRSGTERPKAKSGRAPRGVSQDFYTLMEWRAPGDEGAGSEEPAAAAAAGGA